MGLRLKISLAMAMFLAVQILTVACSEQESDENVGPQKVVVKIHRPPVKHKYADKVQESQVLGKTHSKQRSLAKTQQPEKLPAHATTDTILVSQKALETHESANQEGWYLVGEKDTLVVLAGSSRIYSDPYKWVSLLRLNLSALEPFGLDEGIETRELPQGLGLRFLTPREVAQRRNEIRGRKWVVNILSDKGTGRISGLAVKLVRNGISVYITTAMIKGQQWVRLRAGFFATAAEAKQMRDELEDMLGLTGLWVAKISDEEFDKYAGY